jgi:lipopolysaccharide transport system ATP-binding protein
MTSPIIRVEGLGKRFTLTHRQTAKGYQKLSDTLAHALKAPLRWLKTANREQRIANSTEDFWALRDVSFEVAQGEVLGIIGRNGAGKSTLLKLLSRITEPTTGRITLNGRVASLLEVGTGFHPELTGRENIFLNGTILGMRRSEILAKFDEIVAFAEIEQFLDTPVKRYSSGMYVRLAFAVAAHLDPDILIVDEVLSVGDAQFQKKCLGRIQDIATRGGRTVLFVSHNMNAVEQLSDRVMVLDRGSVSTITNDPRLGVNAYLRSTSSSSPNRWTNDTGQFANEYFTPTSLQIGDSSENDFANDLPITIRASGHVKTEDPALNIGIGLYNEENTLLFWSFLWDTPEHTWPKIEKGPVEFSVTLPPHLLNEGTYRIELLAALHFRLWILEPGLSAPSVNLTIRGGLSESPFWTAKRPGLMAPVLQWTRL